MAEPKTNKSSEICFQDDFKAHEERSYIIWNHLTKKYEEFVLKKEESSLYALYLKEKEVQLPILEFYGIWKDISDEDILYIEESIREIHQKMLPKYYSEE